MMMLLALLSCIALSLLTLGIGAALAITTTPLISRANVPVMRATVRHSSNGLTP